MSSPIPSLAFRDSLDTSAGESTKILSNDPNSNKSVRFSNDPIVYYYKSEYPSNKSLKMNYSDLASPEVPIVYLTKKNKCSNDMKIFMIYFLPIIICMILIIILSIIFYI